MGDIWGVSYIFWPELATIHYAKIVKSEIEKTVSMVLKEDNPPVSGLGAQLTFNTKGSITFTIHSSQTNYHRHPVGENQQ